MPERQVLTSSPEAYLASIVPHVTGKSTTGWSCFASWMGYRARPGRGEVQAPVLARRANRSARGARTVDLYADANSTRPAWLQLFCSGFRTRLQALVPGFHMVVFHMVSFKDRTAIYGFPFRRAFDLSGLSEAGRAPVGNVY